MQAATEAVQPPLSVHTHCT